MITLYAHLWTANSLDGKLSELMTTAVSVRPQAMSKLINGSYSSYQIR